MTRRRPRGHPRRRWKEGVGDCVESRDYRWQEVEEEMCWEDQKNAEDLVSAETGLGYDCKR